MAQVVLFHHVQGLTDGVRAFADGLASGGHTVHTPDLFDGERPASIEAGVAFAQALPEGEVAARVGKALAGLPDGLVFGGFSWGGMHAQRLAQTRPGARGLLMYESFVSLTAPWSFGPWPDGVLAQVHGKEGDPFFAEEGYLEAAREFAAQVGPDVAEVFVYPGDAHLFTDSSLPAYDAQATELVLRRSRELLDRIG